ncbi:hypothetical protein GCM10016455_29440 [Aliiroseovarius zhejiangensis]|uniref:DUF2478 domain-containing protein n=1 Tax=Aliiroseovarius zhejiangensis TaxID=1632025 RepID=A0ABQ3J8Z4_9RHOB|nr:DUF2478 domain-containing protein [Aliiroseovarius zhejiangensis]GHF06381.1 hypothetical protein GCM10016455_29440 [Aliiroseovarius zhejiangensis]
MRIACIAAKGRGETDRLISEAAATLEAEGFVLNGIVKVLQDMPKGAHHCDMDVRVLADNRTIRITQSLGEGSEGCRLNPAAIAEAVAAVDQASSLDADVFILNKFGPEEAEGRGFRAAIAAALEQDIPVLVGLGGGEASRKGFADFVGDMAETLPADPDAILTWVRG